MTKRTLAVAACVLLIITGLTVNYGGPVVEFVGQYVSLPWSHGVPVRAVIVRETSVTVADSKQLVELYNGAGQYGVAVWDDDVLGKGKAALLPDDQKIIDAAKTLPSLVLMWSSGRVTVKPCGAMTLEELRKEVGK